MIEFMFWLSGFVLGFVVCADLAVDSLKRKGLWEIYTGREQVSVRPEKQK